MKKPRGTIYAVVRTGHHVRILEGAMQRLRALGYTVEFAHFRNNPGASGSVAQIRAAGFKPILVRTMKERLGPNDTVVFAVLGGLNTNDGLGKLVAKGVRLAQVCEGGRFHALVKYHPTLPIPLLAWGPSALGIGLADVRVVGAPAMERLGPRAPVVPKTALINYKFTYNEADLDADGAWAQAAQRAAHRAGLVPVFSRHPTSTAPEGISFSDRPVSDLLCEADILITRASTVIYDALRLGVQPFYLRAQGERLREYADPFGSYPLCEGEADLSHAISQWQTGVDQYDLSGFLGAHVSIDPKRSAALRMADEVAKIHMGPALLL